MIKKTQISQNGLQKQTQTYVATWFTNNMAVSKEKENINLQ